MRAGGDFQGRLGNYDVKMFAAVIVDDPDSLWVTKAEFTPIYLGTTPGAGCYGRSCMTQYGNVPGVWLSTESNLPWVASHEVGHIFGLPDLYFSELPTLEYPGAAGTLMASYLGSFDQATLGMLLAATGCNTGQSCHAEIDGPIDPKLPQKLGENYLSFGFNSYLLADPPPTNYFSINNSSVGLSILPVGVGQYISPHAAPGSAEYNPNLDPMSLMNRTSFSGYGNSNGGWGLASGGRSFTQPDSAWLPTATNEPIQVDINSSLDSAMGEIGLDEAIHATNPEEIVDRKLGVLFYVLRYPNA